MPVDKKSISKILAMIAVFVTVDLVLFITFGVIFLNQMEFTGLKILSSEAPTVLFSWKDYVCNCTVWCILEDFLIVAIYSIYIRRHPDKIDRRKEIVYFWLIHINIKIFLNIHSTAMFLSVLDYARESRWREFLLGDADFIVPEHCFDAGRNSLLLSLCVIVITFYIVLHYPEWMKKPFKFIVWVALDLSMFLLWSDRVSLTQKLIIIAGLVIILLLATVLQKHDFRIPRKKRPVEGKINLHKYVSLYTGIFLACSGAWLVIRLIIPSDNMNSLFGMQYSAILKFLTPIFLMINLLLEKTEKSNPEKYEQHAPNLYKYNTLTVIITGCCMLMLFGEFGSVVCIMGLTMIMFLLLVDFADGKEDMKRKIPISLVWGILIGMAFVAVENMIFQFALKSGDSSLDLGGAIGNIQLNHWVCLLAGILCAIGLAAFFVINFLALFIPESELAFFRNFKIKFLNWLEKNFGKLTIHFSISRKKHTSGSQKRLRIQDRISVCIMIPLVGFFVIYYNFFLNAYSGKTVLKSFYMTAGNFSNEFEIMENITQKRATDVANAKRMQTSGAVSDSTTQELPDEIKNQLNEQSANQHAEKEIKTYFDMTETSNTLEELESYYHTKFYTGHYLKLMHIIDRLCYSSKTAELSAVQKGLKQNMGFDIQETSQHQTYISSLQKKYFLTKQDVQNSSPEVKAVYYNDDGSMKDGFFLLNSNGSPAEQGETEYIWYYANTKVPYGVTYHDEQTVIYEIDAQELQRIFKYAEPMTASSDYVLYTLSRMGVGNVLLLIFIPYFFMIVLLLATNMHSSLQEHTGFDYLGYLLHQLGTLYAISFMIQTIVIVWGVFGVSLFSGLSLPLVASGNFEMFLNSICTAVIFISVGNPNKHMSQLKESVKNNV